MKITNHLLNAKARWIKCEDQRDSITLLSGIGGVRADVQEMEKMRLRGGLFPATTSTLLPSFFLIHTINSSPTRSLFMASFSSSSSPHLFPYLILHSTFPNRFYHLQPLLPVLPSYLSSADPCFAYLLIMSKTLKPQNIGLRLF